MEPKLIIFDLNNTLIRDNSWRNLNLALGVSPEEDDILMKWGSKRIINDQQGQDILCEIYRSRSDVSRNRIEQILYQYTYIDGAQEIIEKLLARKYLIALVSGSIDILTAHVAEELGITYWHATNAFVFDSDDKLEKIISSTYDTDDKVRYIKNLCKEISIKPSECLAIGDGKNDQGLFELTGNGVTFTNSPLKDKARFTISSLKEIENIIS